MYRFLHDHYLSNILLRLCFRLLSTFNSGLDHALRLQMLKKVLTLLFSQKKLH